MATKITFGNLFGIKSLIEQVVDRTANVVPVLRCSICDQEADPGDLSLEDLREFLEGAAFYPSDPFPKGTRVVERWLERAGEVIESKVIGLTGPHKHRREICVEYDGIGGLHLYHMGDGYDGISDRFVTEREWPL